MIANVLWIVRACPAVCKEKCRLSLLWGSQVRVGLPANLDMVELPNEDSWAEHLPEIC